MVGLEHGIGVFVLRTLMLLTCTGIVRTATPATRSMRKIAIWRRFRTKLKKIDNN